MYRHICSAATSYTKPSSAFVRAREHETKYEKLMQNACLRSFLIHHFHIDGTATSVPLHTKKKEKEKERISSNRRIKFLATSIGLTRCVHVHVIDGRIEFPIANATELLSPPRLRILPFSSLFVHCSDILFNLTLASMHVTSNGEREQRNEKPKTDKTKNPPVTRTRVHASAAHHSNNLQSITTVNDKIFTNCSNWNKRDEEEWVSECVWVCWRGKKLTGMSMCILSIVAWFVVLIPTHWLWPKRRKIKNK